MYTYEELVVSGRLTLLTGSNGSGKTTLLRRFAQSHRGEVAVVWAPDADDADPGLTVGELLEFGGGEGGKGPACGEGATSPAWLFADCLALRRRRIGTLSSGERQKAFLAMALSQGHTALLLDEPTSALDYEGKHAVFRMLAALCHEHGYAALVATHDLDIARAYADEEIQLTN